MILKKDELPVTTNISQVKMAIIIMIKLETIAKSESSKKGMASGTMAICWCTLYVEVWP